MEQLIDLKSLAPKRDAVLLICSLVCAGLLQGWWRSLGFVGALVFGRQLLSAWFWKRRVQLVQRTIEERFPELHIVKWGEPIQEIQWRHDSGAIHHPLECRDLLGDTRHLNVITGVLTGQVQRVQIRRPFDIYRDIGGELFAR
jgi:hypothetical protein